MNFILTAVLVLGTLALMSSVVLYTVAKKFFVQEDARISQVQQILPGANCGGCGFSGCAGFANALVKGADAGSIENLYCPVGGSEVMAEVADYLQVSVATQVPMIAVVRCNGSCEHRERIAEYDGLMTCEAIHSTGSGETKCGFGCLGAGDCVAACAFKAIHIDKATGLPVVDENKCTSCGACVKNCPRNIIELRKKGRKNRRIYINCVNKDKGGIARKACAVSCIGCGKCEKVCSFDAIKIEDNLAYIDFNLCRLCTKCVDECPTNAIAKLNFPVKKVLQSS